MGEILVIDDDRNTRNKIISLYDATDHNVFGARSFSEADNILKKQEIDVVLLDVELGSDLSGIDYIGSIRKQNRYAQIIMVTKYKDIDRIIQAIKKGAFYYLTKPLNTKEILIFTEKALKMSWQARKTHHLENEVTFLTKKLELSEARKKPAVIGKSPLILDIQRQLARVHESGKASNILLYGESGVGKEVFARSIHNLANEGSNTDIPFVAVNCTSIPSSLFESECFGHEKGAFTGADRTKIGFFEAAKGGYIFLDEIGDLPIHFQPKLLRALQEKQIRRVGGSKTIDCDFKLITATNQDLQKNIADNRFREDLFYRISTIDINIPPLRKRPEDIPPLVNHFIKEMNRSSKLEYPPLDQPTMTFLMDHHWPGNVRELKNAVEKLLVLGFDGTKYDMSVLSIPTRSKPVAFNNANDDDCEIENDRHLSGFLNDIRNKVTVDIKQFMTSKEKRIYEEALKVCENSGLRASRLLGVSKTRFYEKLKQLGIR